MTCPTSDRLYHEWLVSQGYYNPISWLDWLRLRLLAPETLRAIKKLEDRFSPGLGAVCEGDAGSGMSLVRYVSRFGLARLVARL